MALDINNLRSLGEWIVIRHELRTLEQDLKSQIIKCHERGEDGEAKFLSGKARLLEELDDILISILAPNKEEEE